MTPLNVLQICIVLCALFVTHFTKRYFGPSLWTPVSPQLRHGWSSCPECNHPLELADIMSQAHFDGSLDTKPEAEKMFESYRDVLRKLSDAYMEIMTLKKKELDATVEQLQLKTRLFKLQKKHLELLRENKALKNIVTLNH
ncbi:unnamed protein product [Wuchereria bancrofti]|uniref:Uncharacterized protein n=1 Tax=Wuchereria bancrofti TaxID=6293 RepID=A0A3P7FTY8_WUCBA|nr:unnamed protein product [Wuchereria bancrofti]